MSQTGTPGATTTAAVPAPNGDADLAWYTSTVDVDSGGITDRPEQGLMSVHVGSQRLA